MYLTMTVTVYRKKKTLNHMCENFIRKTFCIHFVSNFNLPLRKANLDNISPLVTLYTSIDLSTSGTRPYEVGHAMVSP